VDYANDHEGLGKDFKVSDEMFSRFKTYLGEREKLGDFLEDFNLTLSDSLMDASRDYLDRGIRREIARRVDGPTAAYKVAIEADTQLHEALELFKKYPTLDDLLKAAADWNEEQMKILASEVAAKEEETVAN
jgi:hypothetical protein